MKIGKLKEERTTIALPGEEVNAPIVIADELDLELYDDITSIESWDKYSFLTSVEIIREGIIELIADWSSLSEPEKKISAKWFTVDKNLRDEVLTQEDQLGYINDLILRQKQNKEEDFSSISNGDKEDIDRYLDLVKKSNFIKSTNFSKLLPNSINISSSTYVKITDVEFNDVPIGVYYLNMSCVLSGPNNSEVNTAIFINDDILSNSELTWESNNATGNSRNNRTTHSYINFPIIINENSDIDIRIQSSIGTVNIRSISFSLIKI